MGWLSLFSPSQKLIDELRDELEVIAPCQLPFNKKTVWIIQTKEFSFATDLSRLKPAVLAFDSEAESTDFPFHVKLRGATSEKIQHFQADASFVEIEALTVFVRRSGLIDENDITVCWWKADRNVFPFETKAIGLISASAILIRQLEFSSFLTVAHQIPAKGLVSLECVCRSVEIPAFQIIPKRFSFSSSVPDEPVGLFAAPNQKRTGLRIPRLAKNPEPPPKDREPSLEDRLRAILFPPIEELLSDPQLALPEYPHPYQVFGIKWLHDRESALLADEMGLGKTMQAIIAARLLMREGAIKGILIVCPKPLISNWRRELRKWWPGIECYTKTVGENRQWFLRDATKDTAVKIINYEALAKELDWMKARPPYHDLIIIDEAQRIKTATAARARAVKILESRRRWALTGTPVENNQSDLVSIFGFVKAGLVHDSNTLDVIRDRTKPFRLRRKQEEVLKDLPEKIDQDIEVELGDRQRSEYERLEAQGVQKLNEMGQKISVTHVFTLISELRKICNFDPATGQSAKADLISEELAEIAENNRKALVFGKLVEEPYGLKSLAKVLTDFSPLQLHGGIPQKQRDHVIQAFEKGADCNVLLLNYDVGGVGLNLQAANYVFLFDRWWNPAVEDQAAARAHRLGQKLPVFVKRLYCKDTIEERIVKKLAEKRRIFSLIIDENRPADALGLSEEEYFGLFKDLTVRPSRIGTKAPKPQRVLENMDATEFEILVAAIYEIEGYEVRVTGRSHDGGIDIDAERTSGGGRDRVVVQCKRQTANVGRPVVQQLWGVLTSDHTITRCDLVTSSDFTREAREFAKGKRITLVDGKALKERAEKHDIASFVSPTSGDANTTNMKRDKAQSNPKPLPTESALDENKTLNAYYYGEFKELGSWARVLKRLGLPEDSFAIGITGKMTLAEARQIAARHRETR